MTEKNLATCHAKVRLARRHDGLGGIFSTDIPANAHVAPMQEKGIALGPFRVENIEKLAWE